MEARAHIFVSGRVQGVFFRDHTQRWASSLHLRGWVRNLRDGRVEVLVEGNK
ncbi:MAG: acylphosphatase, partial [Deltaproteobacteria bacterium]|nr:acylphosphatase [Deltaproteobacteria bacterium]